MVTERGNASFLCCRLRAAMDVEQTLINGKLCFLLWVTGRFELGVELGEVGEGGGFGFEGGDGFDEAGDGESVADAAGAADEAKDAAFAG